jgi:hypothetical protein
MPVGTSYLARKLQASLVSIPKSNSTFRTKNAGEHDAIGQVSTHKATSAWFNWPNGTEQQALIGWSGFFLAADAPSFSAMPKLTSFPGPKLTTLIGFLG